MKNVFKNTILWIILIVVGVLIYAISGFVKEGRQDIVPPSQQQKEAQGSIAVTNAATGEQQVTNDPKAREVLNIMQGMREKERLARENAPSSEERQNLYNSVIEEIEAHMVDPAPGQYPVTFFDPEEVPFIRNGADWSLPLAYWIDNDTVLYLGYKDHKADLWAFNTRNHSIKHISPSHTRGTFCFNGKTRRLVFPQTDEKAPQEFINRSGWLNEDLTFTEEFNDGGDVRKYQFGKLDCEAVTHEERAAGASLNNIYWPEDGKLSYKIKPGTTNKRIWGVLLWNRPDGTVKEIKLDGWTTMTPEHPRYDPLSDRYFLMSHFSERDQRIKVWWFDRRFNLVEGYVLPRVHTFMSHPGPIFMDKPVRGGFITHCGHRDDEPGNLDPWGKQKHSYLCLVTPDDGGKIIRVLTGKVGASLAVSPDGCSVFGFWKPYRKAHFSEGKNFVVDLCQNSKEEK